MSASFLGDSTVAIGRTESAGERNFVDVELAVGVVVADNDEFVYRCVDGAKEVICEWV
jgi:hypothetical protein